MPSPRGTFTSQRSGASGFIPPHAPSCHPVHRESATAATQIAEGPDPNPRPKASRTRFAGLSGSLPGGACKAGAHARALADAVCGQRRGGSSGEAKRGRFTGNRLNAPLERYARAHRSPWGIKTTMPLRNALPPLYCARPECTEHRRTCSTGMCNWGVPCGDSGRVLCSLQPALRLCKRRAGPRTRPGSALNIPRWCT